MGTQEDDGTLLPGERQVLEMIATDAPLEDVMHALCSVIDRKSGLMCGVFLVDGGGTRLIRLAGPNFPEAWSVASKVLPLTPTATTCGAAASRGRQVIEPDVLHSPLFAGFHEIALESGIRAAWSTPFFSRDRRVLGTFVVLSPTPGVPDESHLQLVERATHLARIAVERHQAAAGLRESERLLRLVLDALPVGVAVLDPSGNVIVSNPASDRIWSGVIQSGKERYARSKGWSYATGQPIGPDEWASVRALKRGETTENEILEIEAHDGIRKIIRNSTVPILDENDRITGAVVVNEDITASKSAERELSDSYNQLRTLAGRLMRAQDDERRRIALMMHETTAQDLAALKMLLGRLNRSTDRLSESDRGAINESTALAEQAMADIRTLSYLLHPPFLDETGLVPALRWYASGFAERSGIVVELALPEDFERLPLDTETALFRIVQESLINIHRHAESATARIRLRREADSLLLEIEDAGHGIPEASLTGILSGGGGRGVGIAGMHERVEQLGGHLEIRSSDRGTTVRAELPLGKEKG
jgi:signal transduction histidine kinase